MRYIKEEPTWIIDQPIDVKSAVEELNGLGSQELNKLLRDAENFTLLRSTEKGSKIQIDMERLARCLPVHLIAVLVSSGGNEMSMQYMLRGFRLLHSFCDLASRHTKLEQILLEEVRITEQIMDLIFGTIVDLALHKQDKHSTGLFPLLHSTIMACSLYLLTGYVSSQWKDLVQVLVAHPQVDIFMDAAFNAVRIDIMFLQLKLSSVVTTTLCDESNPTPVERVAHTLCQHCEASLQFLHTLCQQKLFRERLLKNMELCKNGGVLLLVQAVLNLDTPHYEMFSKVAASVSRMKSKVLSILLQLCETESVSYLDEVASSPRSMELAKFVATEVLKLMKTAFESAEGSYPGGLVLLNTMRLADIFSDDSNFRYFITIDTTYVLAEMLLLTHEEFLTSWCSVDLEVVEEDASLDYDPFVAAGVVSILLSTGLETSNMECAFNLNRLPQASYAQHRSSLLVKIIANLHCFVPNICEEQERNLFFNKFVECLRMALPKSSAGLSISSSSQNGATVCKNLGSLLDYATSLVPTFLNEEDVLLLSKFSEELQSYFTSKVEVNLDQEHDQDKKVQHSLGFDKFSTSDAVNQEIQSGGHVSPLTRKVDLRVPEVSLDLRKCDYPKEGTSESLLYEENVMMVGRRNDKSETSAPESLREIDNDVHNVDTSGSEASSTRGNDNLDHLLDNDESLRLAKHISESKFKVAEENDKSESTNGDEKRQWKRKRNIMNDKQIALIEQALLDEPEMQRNAASLQLWADKLSVHGSELTCSQLKNWLNNRKAKLLRMARGTRAPSEGDAYNDKSGGLAQVHFYDSPESLSEETYVPSTTRRGSNQAQQSTHSSTAVGYIRFEPGQFICLLDKGKKEIGKGKVFQVEGVWHGKCLEEVGTCVVDITELKVERRTRLPHPSEAYGTTFEEAEAKNGTMRVEWGTKNIIMLPQ